jgi:hypothetical protein
MPNYILKKPILIAFFAEFLYNIFMESLGKIVKAQAKKSVKPKADVHLHSPAHLLADELSLKFNDRKHFALYLGMAMKHDHQFLRKIMGEVLEKNTVQTPGRLFSYLVKKYNQENKQVTSNS